MAEDGGRGKRVEGFNPKLVLDCQNNLKDKNVDIETKDEPVNRHTLTRRKSHELCIITCKGTLGDPAFNKSFRRILSGLNKLLNTGEERVRVRKVEPWNSVRVTFTIPGDAAQRLRALALGGDSVLSRLGILSVQLDPDQVIRVGAGVIQPPPPQQVDPNSFPLPPSSTLPGLGGTAMSCLPGSSLSGLVGTSVLNSGPLPVASTIIGSTNVPGSSRDPLSLPGPSGIVAGPSTSGLCRPMVAIAGPSTSGLNSPLMTSASLPGQSAGSVIPGASSSIPPSLAGPSGLPDTSTTPLLPPPTAQPRATPPKVFPFHSMNQAANVMRAAEQPPQASTTRQVVGGYPPPPYPSKVEGQVLSPLLVNLLQDSSASSTKSITSQNNLAPPPAPAPQVQIKQEESTPSFVPEAGCTSTFGTGAFRRLPPPYPGRVKEELPQPTRDIIPITPTTHVIEDKKSQDNHQESSSSSSSKRQYLINPLTGVLEPMSSEDEEEEKTEPILDDDLSLDKDISITSNTTTSLVSNSTVSTISNSDITSNSVPSSAPPVISVSDHPPTSVEFLPQHPKEEKIKLRLKLDKEAVVSVGTVVSSDNPSSNLSSPQETHTSPGYKVEMFVKRSHESNHLCGSGGIMPNQIQPSEPQINSALSNNGIEVPRVPPLHISLRGRNAAVVKKDKKRDAKKARKISGELKRAKSSKLVVNQPTTVMPISPERSPESTEGPTSPSPASPRNDPELSGEIVPVRNYPSEAEVASILRSVVPHTTHKLLDESRLKRRESKKKMYPRLEYTGSKKGTKKCSGSLLKSVVKTNSKEVRMMSAVNKAIHRRDSADSTVTNVFVNSALKQRSNSVPGTSGNPNEEFRPKVNCVFSKATVPPSTTEPIEGPKVTTDNICVNSGNSPHSTETPSITTTQSQKNLTDPAKRNNEGDDSGIESMDALSEKSPNQGESPQRTTGSSVGCKSVNVTCADASKPVQSQTTQLSMKDDQLGSSDIVSGGGESPVPVRLTPALYTYSNPEKSERRGGAESLSPCSTSGDEEDPLLKSHPSPEPFEEFSIDNSGRRSGSNKSLLEQLLIDVPSETNTSATTNTSNTPSTNNSNCSEPSDIINNSSNSNQMANNRRSRPTRHKTWDAQTWQTNHIDSRQSTLRVSKRKCSESASEGKSEDNSSPASTDKPKLSVSRPSSNHGEEEADEHSNSVNSGNAISNRSSVSPAPPAPTSVPMSTPLQSPRLRHTKAEQPETPQLDKNTNGNGSINMKREVSVVLTKISRRTSVRQQKAASSNQSTTISPQKADPNPTTSPPENTSAKEINQPVVTPAAQRRKTRSQASDSNNEEGGSSTKRRRMSKDMK